MMSGRKKQKGRFGFWWRDLLFAYMLVCVNALCIIMCVYMRVCVYARMCICACVYIYARVYLLIYCDISLL